MQKPLDQRTWRLIDWIIVPWYRPEYRRLLLWSFTLSVRLELLNLAVTLVGPFATPSLIGVLRRRFDNLQAEVAAFKRAVRAPRARRVARPVTVRQERLAVTEYENPWG